MDDEDEEFYGSSSSKAKTTDTNNNNTNGHANGTDTNGKTATEDESLTERRNKYTYCIVSRENGRLEVILIYRQIYISLSSLSMSDIRTILIAAFPFCFSLSI